MFVVTNLSRRSTTWGPASAGRLCLPQAPGTVTWRRRARGCIGGAAPNLLRLLRPLRPMLYLLSLLFLFLLFVFPHYLPSASSKGTELKNSMFMESPPQYNAFVNSCCRKSGSSTDTSCGGSGGGEAISCFASLRPLPPLRSLSHSTLFESHFSL